MSGFEGCLAIPKTWFLLRLTPGDLFILALIDEEHDRGDGIFRAGIKGLSKIVNQDKHMIKKSLSVLVSLGFVIRDKREIRGVDSNVNCSCVYWTDRAYLEKYINEERYLTMPPARMRYAIIEKALQGGGAKDFNNLSKSCDD